MKSWHWIIALIILAGVFSGPAALEAATAAQPPIEWSDIPFVFVGSAFGMLFVIGIQLFRRKSKFSKRALQLLSPASLYFFVSGVSAAFLAVSGGEVMPHAFLIFSVGSGTLLGVGVSWLMYRHRFQNELETR